MKLYRIDNEKASAEETPAASLAEPENETAACGPGCLCGTPAGNKKMKAMASLIVLLAVGGIFVYKASSAKQNAMNNIADKGAAFAVAQAPSAAMPGVEAQSSMVAEQKKTKEKIGEVLESFSALGKVAMNQDAVFIYIPSKSDEPVASKTNDAILGAQRTLKSNGIALGLYTLPTGSPDYSAISAQVQSPAILVARKGGGMAAVSGEATETKLLQAFMASSRAGGCGSGCGPSGAGCN